MFSLFFLFIFFNSFRKKKRKLENFTQNLNYEILNNKSICIKKHLDAYVNCVLLDFEMYTNQNRDWNKKWNIDCNDTNCETVKEKSKRECKISIDDEYMQEFVNLQHNKLMPYHKSEYAKTHCLNPIKDMMSNKIISKYINRIDTEVEDSSSKINLLGVPNKKKLSNLYKNSIEKIKEEINNIDYSKSDL